MAEFVFNHLVKGSPLEGKYTAYSKATSYEEEGNSPHRGTLQKLREEGIPVYGHRSSRLEAADYGEYDMIIGMEESNLWNIMRIIKSDPECKVHKLLDFAGGGDIDDPWYTGDFDSTYRDISLGVKGLITFLQKDTPQ